MEIRIEDINRWLTLSQSEDAAEFRNFFIFDEDEEKPDITQAFEQVSGKLVEWHRERGFNFEGDTLYCDPTKFDEIAAMYETIIKDLDEQDASGSWARFELGGDDDVDYCGTHPAAGMRALKAFIKESNEAFDNNCQ